MKRTVFNLLTRLAILIAIIMIAMVSNYLYAAWSNPPPSPTSNNTPIPLNIGTSNQIKNAGLTLLLLIVNGKVQIKDGSEGNNKVLVSNEFGVASWVATSSLDIADGGGGGITNLSQGSGIILSPNPITDTGTISANTSYLQRRVLDSCPAGQAIESIKSDGSVQCITLPPNAPCIYAGKTYSIGEECALDDKFNSVGFHNATTLRCFDDGWHSGGSMTFGWPPSKPNCGS